MQTWGIPNSPFQGLSEYTPHTPHPPRDTQWAQIRQQWHRPPKTHVSIIGTVPERYTPVSQAAWPGRGGWSLCPTGPVLRLIRVRGRSQLWYAHARGAPSIPSSWYHVMAMSSYKFTPRAVASPDAPQKPLTRKRARSGGVKWVQVTWHEPGSRAKNPRTSRSQPPACSHKEHDILTTAEATAFAAQFWDRKTHPTKASQHELLATCIDVDVDKNVKYNNYQKYTIKTGQAHTGPQAATQTISRNLC